MNRALRVSMWVLAFAVAIASLRYFLIPPVWLNPPVLDQVSLLTSAEAEAARSAAPYLYANHRILLLSHITGGIVAITLGLFQFARSLRESRPRLHRALGMTYVLAVVGASMVGFPLSFYSIGGAPEAMKPRFYPVVVGFASLSLAWLAITAMAYIRARQHRYDEHRAWMIRSYSLTFAAVTVRLISPVLLILSSDVVFTVNASILSWPLNLIVAELLIRRPAVRIPAPA
jgi:uncharacterized membrane protein